MLTTYGTWRNCLLPLKRVTSLEGSFCQEQNVLCWLLEYAITYCLCVAYIKSVNSYNN